MCGIAGIIGKKELSQGKIKAYIAAFKSSLVHRGPDDAGEHIGVNSGFAHRRLSIVDISGGHQPIYNEDRSVGIVYNGEIYNYTSLREDLKKKGYRFFTNTDTEVILRGYEEYGTEFFDELNGMFAFCIWDDNTDTVYLVRDFFGIKPLYIYEDGSRIIFASELKAIIAIPDIDQSLDPAGFQDYLTFRYVQAPYTFFKNIRKLEAGTYLEIKHGNATQYRYWDVSYSSPYPYPDVGEVKEHLLATMRAVVKSQLMGEVPIGVLLSGGVDSSTIAYLIHACGANLTTFNIGFPEVNEFEYSRKVAKKYGLRHVEIVTTAGELIKNFSKINFALDEPIADPACLPLYQLCEELKKHVTVVLSGEGGDEVFGGYPQYGYLCGADIPYGSRFGSFMERSWYFSDSLAFMNDKRIPLHQLRYRKYFEEQPLLNGMLAFDMKTWMPENLMMKADKIFMAHSLEGRFPFLDKRLFEYVARLPQGHKITAEGVTKWLLKEVIAPFLPKKVITRPKMGFTVPVDSLLKELKPFVIDACEALQQSSLSEALDTRHIRKCINGYYAGGNISSLQVWTLFTMAYWFTVSFPRYKNEKNVLPGRAQYLKEAFTNNTPQQKMDLRRKISEQYVMGKGVEIGALHCPLHVGPKADIKYVDLHPKEELMKLFPEIASDLRTSVDIDILDDGETLTKIENESLDFLVANHFLEHCVNTLGTIRTHLSKLRRGGILYYAIPNKDYTFDRGRPLTTFEHISQDDLENSEQSQLEHYKEWAEFVDKLTDDSKIENHAKQLMEKDNRIHFHCWDAMTCEEFLLGAQKYLNYVFTVECYVQNENEIIAVLRKSRQTSRKL